MLKGLHRDPDPSWNNLQDPDPNQIQCIWIHNTGLNAYQ